MHVFRHHHVSDYSEFVSRTHLVKYFYESIARFSCSQKGSAPVTTKRHKMEMASAVNSSQRISHQVKTRTLKLEACGTQNLYPLRIVPDDILRDAPSTKHLQPEFYLPPAHAHSQ